MSTANIRDRLRQIFTDITTERFILAADTSIQPFITGKPKYTIYLQEVQFDVSIDAAQTLTVQDTSTTPRVFAVVPASPGKGPQKFDFGDEGLPCGEGKNVDVVLSAAGLSGGLKIYGYLKPTSTRAITEI